MRLRTQVRCHHSWGCQSPLVAPNAKRETTVRNGAKRSGGLAFHDVLGASRKEPTVLWHGFLEGHGDGTTDLFD